LYHQCAWCGTKFYMRHPTLWRYKETFKGETKHFCSWGCLSNARKHSVKKATGSGTITYGKINDSWKRTEDITE